MSHALASIVRRPNLISCFALICLLGISLALAPLPIVGPRAGTHSPSAVQPCAAVRNVESVGFTVSDMDRSIAFYRDVLTFELASDIEVAGEPYERLTGVFGVRLRIVGMRLGSESIELTEFLTPSGRPIPVDSASNDRLFQHIAIITPDMPGAYQHLREHKIRHASTGPQRLPDWNKDAGGIEAFYFLDPDNHVLEVLSFPPGKGNPKWRERAVHDSSRLFLGIDHTAIVIGDSAASLHFYRDVLGMDVAGTSDNWGTEQEHLNNVRGARLHITSVRPDDSIGPSVEFLQYVQPVGGRPFPIDSRANDLWHWQMTIVVDDLDALLQQVGLMDLRRNPMVANDVRAAWVSDGVVTMTDSVLGFRKAAVIRDPDGHALRLVER